jgi:hypothetical protein
MPKYVAGKDLKNSKGRIFNPSESDYMNKKSVVNKLIGKLNGEHRRHKLEKALNKMNVDDVVMIGMAIETTISKEIQSRKLLDD